MPTPTSTRAFLRSATHYLSSARSSSTSARPKTYPPQYRVMFRKVARSTAFFIPGYFILLGWPLFPPLLFNGHMYGLGREPWTKV